MRKRPIKVQAKYDRIAPVYDLWDGVPEWWRQKLWSKVTAGHTLEIGVGTGKNIHLYPPGLQVVAIDFSPGMLLKAAAKARRSPEADISLALMDAGALAFPAAVFDSVVETFTLMVAPDPLKILTEAHRVCKPGGRLLLLEFARSRNRIAAFFQNLLTPLTRAIWGAYLNRDITGLIESSDFEIVSTESLAGGLAQLICARPTVANRKTDNWNATQASLPF